MLNVIYMCKEGQGNTEAILWPPLLLFYYVALEKITRKILMKYESGILRVWSQLQGIGIA